VCYKYYYTIFSKLFLRCILYLLLFLNNNKLIDIFHFYFYLDLDLEINITTYLENGRHRTYAYI
jgi:hypothetical protein